MADLNPSSNISTYIQTIYEDAMFVARENTLATKLVTIFNDRTGAAVRSRSEYGTATMNSVGETDDLVSQAFTPSVKNSLTPAEVAAQFFLPDLRIESDPFGVRSDAALELGMAVAEKVDRDVFGNFSSLTGGTVGAAGSTITWGHFFAMQSRLRAQKAPGPWVFVCHPHQYHYLGKAIAPGATVTNSPELQDEAARKFFVGNVGGVDIFVSSNLAIDSSADAVCAMFSKPALAYDNRRAPRLEPERDASRRGWELNESAVYAHGVWRPKYGVKGTFDATAPSS